MPDTTVGSAGDGAPSSARESRRARRLPNPINGTEQRLDAVLEVLDEVLHELRQVRLDAAGLDEVKEGDPVLELTEPVPTTTVLGTPAIVLRGEGDSEPVELAEPDAPAPAPVELTEPAPGPARPAARPTKKKAAAKKAPTRP